MAATLALLDDVSPATATAYIAAGRPFAVRDAAKHWPCVGTWTPRLLRDRVGHRQVAQVSLDWQELHEFSFADYLDLLDARPAQVDALPYIRNQFLHQCFAELSRDVGRLEWLGVSWLEREPLATLIRAMRPHWIDWCELFVSQPDVRFPKVHVDNCMFHSWNVQVHGIKRFWVWPARPDFEDVDCIGVDLDRVLPDEPVLVELGPGDAVVIPGGLPHTAQSVTTSISVAGSFVDASNWEPFWQEFCAKELGRDLWRRSNPERTGSSALRRPRARLARRRA